MNEIRNIDYLEFKRKIEDDYYKYIIGAEQGEERYCRYEILFTSNIKIGVMATENNHPKIMEWQDKIIVYVNNECQIFSKNYSILKAIRVDCCIYEVKTFKEYAIIFGEIDIIVINKNANILKNIKLDDILNNYSISNKKLKYKLENGIEKTIDIF